MRSSSMVGSQNLPENEDIMVHARDVTMGVTRVFLGVLLIRVEGGAPPLANFLILNPA